MITLTFRQKVCLGLYFVSSITAIVLLTLYCRACIEKEMIRVQRERSVPSSLQRVLRRNMALPTYRLYKGNHWNSTTVLCKDTIDRYILRLPWVTELHQLLVRSSSNNSPLVNLVVADLNSIELLLNWLIAALVRLTDPLQNVLVLGLDKFICDLLRPHNVTCIYINPVTFIRGDSEYLRFSRLFIAPQTRLLVARLINSWGYSFASYDTDAVILKNPQPLYDEYKEADVIAGAAGRWPYWSIEEWGFAVCLGATLVRSGPATEQLWQAISKSWGALGSEQDQFNQALRNHIKWNTTSLNTTSPDALCNQKYGWRGISEKITDFSLLLLPQSQFCRGSCCDGSGYDLSDLYVAHGGGGRTGDTNRKVLYSQSRGVWFLRRNWRKLKRSSSTGVDWLRQLSTL